MDGEAMDDSSSDSSAPAAGGDDAWPQPVYPDGPPEGL